MIDRYTLPEMRQLWDSTTKYQTWLDVELAACEAWAELGRIPQDALAAIRERAGFDVERIEAIEQETRHDVIAFTTAVAERVGDASKYIHMGLTSSDVLDTAQAVLMRRAVDLILQEMDKLRPVLVELAIRHKSTIMTGRTHGIHAEPVTFGLKMALWITEIDRQRQRLVNVRGEISVGKISGAVGTYAHLDPRVEEYVCSRLELQSTPVSTQIIQRDRHAALLNTLALVAASLEKFATEIRNLQRTDILEVAEAFGQGQKGSSAMPHKRNPITAEQVAGLARVVRGNALVGMENVALWHERDLTHSSVERVIIPDSTTLVHYMLRRFTGIMRGLQVYPQRMQANMEKTLGLVFSQRVLLALVERGVLREIAYQWVQRNALQAWDQGIPFLQLLLADQEIAGVITPAELEALFDYKYFLQQVDYIFQRVGLEKQE